MAQARGSTEFHGVGDHFGMIGTAASKLSRQQDMGGTTATTPPPARDKPSIHHRDPATDHTLHPKTPRPQPPTARRAHKLTVKELGFDSGRIVAYRKQQRDSFRVRTTWCGFETGTGSFVF